MESVSQLSNCFHYCLELPFSVRHAKLEQSRINLISFSLVLKADSHCSIPIKLGIKDFSWLKYCFL